MDKKNIIVCVLKVGGDIYQNEYVEKLAAGVKRHTTVANEFVCITGSSVPFSENIDRVIPLKHSFPGWWSKIELFNQPDFKGHNILFLDLDTVIVANIDEIVTHNATTLHALEDFYFPENLGSGMMMWTGGEYDHIYTKFMLNPTSVINNTPTGDQTWIKNNINSYVRIQHALPKRVVSFKVHCTPNRNYEHVILPAGSSIVCFHGTPKPHNIKNPLIAKNWE